MLRFYSYVNLSCYRVLRILSIYRPLFSFDLCKWFSESRYISLPLSFAMEYKLGFCNCCFLSQQLMLCIFLSRSYKILPIVCKVGIICLGICARGFTLLVTLKAVLQECEQLHLLISFLIFIRVLQSSSNLFVYLISDLGNAALSGELAPELGQLKNLELL